MKQLFKQYWIYIAIGTLAIIGVLFVPTPDNEQPNTNVEPILTDEDPSYIYVDLKGEVNNPGVYKIESSTRLFQVIQLAGGLTSDANILAVNLSILLKDQMVVYIPNIDDDVPLVIDNNDEDDVFLIDINQARLELLETLPGIGPSTAQNIIDYRDENGYFDSIEELMDVPNIGEATFEQIKDLITITK